MTAIWLFSPLELTKLVNPLNGSYLTCNAAVSKKEAQTLCPFDRLDSLEFTKMQNNKAVFSFLFMHIKMLRVRVNV